LTDVEASGDTLDGMDYYFGVLEQFSEVEQQGFLIENFILIVELLPNLEQASDSIHHSMHSFISTRGPSPLVALHQLWIELRTKHATFPEHGHKFLLHGSNMLLLLDLKACEVSARVAEKHC
jgi:hypothetical protein